MTPHPPRLVGIGAIMFFFFLAALLAVIGALSGRLTASSGSSASLLAGVMVGSIFVVVSNAFRGSRVSPSPLIPIFHIAISPPVLAGMVALTGFVHVPPFVLGALVSWLLSSAIDISAEYARRQRD